MKLGESREDYLEAAYVIKLRNGFVRNSLLCKYMSYSKASISVAMRTLREQGYVVRDELGYISLTEKGEAIAKEVYARHMLLKEVLEAIGVSPEVADQDACRMEHAISEETFQKLQEMAVSLCKKQENE